MNTVLAQDPSSSLYRLLDPAVLADPYPLYRRLREEDPIHSDPFLAPLGGDWLCRRGHYPP